jgi:hypothetical protein
VLSVLDQAASETVGIADMNVLALIAAQAAVVLALVQEAREAAVPDGELAAVERALRAADPPRRAAALAAIAALERLLNAE